MWWQAIKYVREGVGHVDSRWLLDNITREVSNDTNTLFWVDLWIQGKPLKSSFARLYELAENKLVTVAEMFAMGWG